MQCNWGHGRAKMVVFSILEETKGKKKTDFAKKRSEHVAADVDNVSSKNQQVREIYFTIFSRLKFRSSYWPKNISGANGIQRSWNLLASDWN